jgi:hypothetical protein
MRGLRVRGLALHGTPANLSAPLTANRRQRASWSADRILAQEWHSFGVAMGYRYDASPVVVPDGTPPTPDDPSEYVPTARPGHRARRGPWRAAASHRRR